MATFNAFIRRMMRKHNLLREDARLATKLVFDTMIEILLEGEEVPFPRFGTFYPRYTKAREWVQPSTGDPIEIPERVRLAFRTTRYFDRMMTQALGGDAHGTEQQAQAQEDPDEADLLEAEDDDSGVEEDA